MRALKVGIAVCLGLLGSTFALERPWAVTMAAKATGNHQPCSWSRLFSFPLSSHHFGALQAGVQKELSVEKTDDSLGIEFVRTPKRSFWIKKAGTAMDGRGLLGYVIAEQQWISEYAGDY